MKRGLAIAVSVILSFGLVACSSASYEPVPPSTDSGFAPDGNSGGGADGDGGSENKDDRSVIKTAAAYLAVDNPAQAADEVGQLATSQQGRVDQENLYTNTDGVSVRAYLVLRIPTDKLEAVIEGLPDIGEVQSLEVGASDVTVTVRDLEARVAALETSVARLLDLLTRAETTSELIEIESALTQRQAELDGLKSTLSYYQDAVSYATLTITLVTEAESLPNTPDNFWEGLGAGWQALLIFLGGLLIASGVVAPWLLAIGLPAALVAWLLVRRSRRAKARAAEIAMTEARAATKTSTSSRAKKGAGTR